MGRKSKAEKLNSMAHMPANSSAAMEHQSESTMPKKSASLSLGTKASKDKRMIIRRSSRLQNLVKSAQNQEIEPVIEAINLVESDGEDEPHVEECIRDPQVKERTREPIPNEKGLEEKIDYLVQTIEELKSKARKRCFSSESTSTDLNYKSLYINSQKKLEALMDEHYQLGKKLEVALGKLEAYENVKEVMEKLKDVLLISNLAKATEMVVNLSSVLGKVSSSGAAVDPDAVVAPQTCCPNKKKKRGVHDKFMISNLAKATEMVVNLSSVLGQSSSGAVDPDAIVVPQTSLNKKKKRGKRIKKFTIAS